MGVVLAGRPPLLYTLGCNDAPLFSGMVIRRCGCARAWTRTLSPQEIGKLCTGRDPQCFIPREPLPRYGRNGIGRMRRVAECSGPTPRGRPQIRGRVRYRPPYDQATPTLPGLRRACRRTSSRRLRRGTLSTLRLVGARLYALPRRRSTTASMDRQMAGRERFGVLSSLLVPEHPARLDVGSGAFKATQNNALLPSGKIELQCIPKRREITPRPRAVQIHGAHSVLQLG